MKTDDWFGSGDAADGMFFIEEGTVTIKIQQDRGETEISKLEKGQYFGELALVTHRPRAASAYAQDNVKVACKFQSSPLRDKIFNVLFVVHHTPIV